eukprot:XP_001704619.1 Hypothetical protein GL50803_31536 [Giardia lamblia ATCC 50803]
MEQGTYRCIYTNATEAGVTSSTGDNADSTACWQTSKLWSLDQCVVRCGSGRRSTVRCARRRDDGAVITDTTGESSETDCPGAIPGELNDTSRCSVAEQDNASSPAITEAPGVQTNTLRKVSPTAMDSISRLASTISTPLRLEASREYTLPLR